MKFNFVDKVIYPIKAFKFLFLGILLFTTHNFNFQSSKTLGGAVVQVNFFFQKNKNKNSHTHTHMRIEYETTYTVESLHIVIYHMIRMHPTNILTKQITKDLWFGSQNFEKKPDVRPHMDMLEIIIFIYVISLIICICYWFRIGFDS